MNAAGSFKQRLLEDLRMDVTKDLKRYVYS